MVGLLCSETEMSASSSVYNSVYNHTRSVPEDYDCDIKCEYCLHHKLNKQKLGQTFTTLLFLTTGTS